jgi:predicted dithiol-disulfide oxidoreductase (DUF899 family)
MYGPDRERRCPGCTHFLDGLDGEAEHIIAMRPVRTFERER